jgi:hypothetical protein
MRGRGRLWTLTALGIASVCVCTVLQGWTLVRYSFAGASPEAVHPWVEVSGVAFSAREYSLTEAADSNDAKAGRERRDQLKDILAVRPLSSEYWLQLAEMRLVGGETPAKALEALDLSILTGAHEGSMITRRGLFGVWQWEVLPPRVQRRAIADLSARQISDRNISWLRETLSEKTENVRQDIRTALQDRKFPPSLLTRIGL